MDTGYIHLPSMYTHEEKEKDENVEMQRRTEEMKTETGREMR